MFNKVLIAKVLLLRNLRKTTRRKPRSMYVRPIFLNRNVQGDSILVQELRLDKEYHFKYFRMDKKNFDIILNRIADKIQHTNTHTRPISPIERLGLTLRYLATGNSQISLAFSYRVSPSAVTSIMACVLLHNFLISQNDLNSVTVDQWNDQSNGTRVDGNWRAVTLDDKGMEGLQRQGSNNYANTAAEVRDYFKNYFMNNGKVNWQENHVNRC